MVTCLKTLATTNAPLVLNTPHLREDDGESPGLFLPDAMATLLDRAKQAAERFMQGDRAQLNLLDVGKVAMDAAREMADSLDEGESVTVSTPGRAPVTLHGKPKLVKS